MRFWSGDLIEDSRAVGGAGVGALAVESGGVVDGEEDAEELAVGDAGGVEDDFDGFGVVGGFGGDLIVGSGAGFATGVAGGGFDDAFDALEYGLRAPEAASSEDGGFAVGGCGERGVGGGRRKGAVGGGGAGEVGEQGKGKGQGEDSAEGA